MGPVREALRVPVRYDAESLSRIYSPRADFTHVIDVRRYAKRKQAALAAQRSEVAKGTGRIAPAMRALVRMPAPLFGVLLGREWYVEAVAGPGRRMR